MRAENKCLLFCARPKAIKCSFVYKCNPFLTDYYSTGIIISIAGSEEKTLIKGTEYRQG